MGCICSKHKPVDPEIAEIVNTANPTQKNQNTSKNNNPFEQQQQNDPNGQQINNNTNEQKQNNDPNKQLKDKNPKEQQQNIILNEQQRDNNPNDQSIINISKNKHLLRYKKPKNQFLNERNEYINYQTIIEIDMRGDDPNIVNPFEWIAHIRQTLLSALQNKVDYVCLIPERGFKYQQITADQIRYVKKKPFLRPLVLMTIKMCGFDCIFNNESGYYIICPISSYHQIAKEEYGPLFDLTMNDETIIKFFNVDPDVFRHMNNEKNRDKPVVKTFKHVRKNFINMPYICHMILASHYQHEELANTMAKKFLKYFNLSLPDNRVNENRDRAFEMSIVETLMNNYYYDRQFIEHVARDKAYDENKIVKILQRVNEIPDHFYSYFMELAELHPKLTVQSLLNLSKECAYDEEMMEYMITDSGITDFERVSNILNNYKALDSLRLKTKHFIELYGKMDMPKIVPTIKIDLSHAGYRKATRSLDRILNLLNSQTFGEIWLVFADENDETIEDIKKVCNLEEIRKFVIQKAEDDQIKIIPNKNQDCNCLQFFITNLRTNEDYNCDIEEEDVIKEDSENEEEDNIIDIIENNNKDDININENSINDNIYVYDNNKDEIIRLKVNKFEDDIIIDNNVKDKDSNAENNNIDDNIIYDHNKGDNYLIQINHFDEDKKDDYFCDNNVDV